jgi:aspartyl-tRNA(Asn)/glutamyl-tRNA(Gln) amidotransferase subunit A
MDQASIAAVAAAVRRRQVSPVELVEQALAAAQRTQPTLNAFIAIVEEDARRAARVLERRAARRQPLGSLAGVTLSIKDLIFTRGTPTTAGSRCFDPGFGAAGDASVVRRLRRAGAIIFGKTNLHEIALGVTSVNEHFGPVRNPWNPAHVAGGSSGGSAAAVAAAIGVASVGTDTRGSIRIPAACCGITGFKPSYGLVPTDGVVPLAPSLDHLGPMTRGADDAAALLAAMIGGARGERLTRDAAARATVKRLRLGVSDYHLRDVDPAIARSVEAAIRDLRPLVKEIHDVKLSGVDQVHGASGRVAGAEAYAFHEPTLRANPDGYGPIVRQRLAGGAKISALDYIRALEQQRVAAAAFTEAFSRVDVLLGAVLPSLPPTIESQTTVDQVARTVHELSSLNAAQNMAGIPAISLPCGFHAGLPIGLQLMAPAGRDAVVLCVASAYQRATEWHRSRPRA